MNFELSSFVGYLVFRLSATLGALAEGDARRVAGLSLPEYRCLIVLTTHRGIGVTALCQMLSIDKAWVSRTLSKLVGKGLAVSSPEPNDARRTIFSATPRGKRIGRLLIDTALDRQARILKGFTVQDWTLFKSLLDRLSANAEEARAAHAGRRQEG